MINEQRPAVSGRAQSATAKLYPNPTGCKFRSALNTIAADLNIRYTDLKAITNDPLKKIDSTADIRDARWLAEQVHRFVRVDTLHPRALHYALASAEVRKPNGATYMNRDENVNWLERVASRARWLGYIPWEMISDSRSKGASIRTHEPPDPRPYINVDLNVYLPDENDLCPRPRLANFFGVQPYRLVLITEKDSCEPVLAPIAERFNTDLYLIKGDTSDTRIWEMARSGSEDGRPMRIFYVSDCDPAGYNMPGVLAHKLRCFKELFYENLSFEVHRVALTPEQVATHGLPSSALKDGERRAGLWRRQMGCEQTEIDALAQLQPELLRQIVTDAVNMFYDDTLKRRAAAAESDWQRQAQEIIDQRIGDEGYALRDHALQQLDSIQRQVEQLTEDFRIDADDFDLPQPVIPVAALDESLQPMGFINSDCSLSEHYRRAMLAKRYESDDEHREDADGYIQ